MQVGHSAASGLSLPRINAVRNRNRIAVALRTKPKRIFESHRFVAPGAQLHGMLAAIAPPCTALHCTALRPNGRRAPTYARLHCACAAKPPRRDACMGASGGRHRVIPAVQENERRLAASRRGHGRPEECRNARDEHHTATPNGFGHITAHITTSNSREDGLVLTMRPPRQHRGSTSSSGFAPEK